MTNLFSKVKFLCCSGAQKSQPTSNIELKNQLYQEKKITDDYRIGKSIGQGSLSVVRVAQNKTTQDLYAVKLINKKGLSKHRIRCCIFEAQILQELDHPNVITFYELFQDQKHLCILTELMSTDLHTHLNRYHDMITEQQIKVIFQQCLEGVKYCHKQGLMHRDIKPSNFIVNVDSNQEVYEVKLADFGLFTHIDGGALDLDQGTMGFQAPEMLNGTGNYNEKIDEWALGVLLYSLITGELPFSGKNQHKQIIDPNKQPSYGQKAWKQCSPTALDLAQQLLDKDFSQRISASEALKHKWFMQSESTTATESVSSKKQLKKSYLKRKILQSMSEE